MKIWLVVIETWDGIQEIDSAYLTERDADQRATALDREWSVVGPYPLRLGVVLPVQT